MNSEAVPENGSWKTIFKKLGQFYYRIIVFAKGESFEQETAHRKKEKTQKKPTSAEFFRTLKSTKKQ